jgi:hypothetical protein
MTTRHTIRSVSRRTALAGLGAGGLDLAIAASGATAQEGTGDLASHPMVDTWAAVTPGGVVPQIHGIDGSFIAAFPRTTSTRCSVWPSKVLASDGGNPTASSAV